MQKKENHNEQYCNYNGFYSWKLIQITLKCDSMRRYTSADVLFFSFFRFEKYYDFQCSTYSTARTIPHAMIHKEIKNNPVFAMIY